jgi:hypothetical protein
MDGICAVCHEDGPKNCSKCKKISYCSIACQRKDWPEHKLVCGKQAPAKVESTKLSQASIDKDNLKLDESVGTFRWNNDMQLLPCPNFEPDMR